MKIIYKIKELKPVGQYKDIQEININGIATRFMNGEFEYLKELSENDYLMTKQWCVDRLIPFLTRKSYNDSCSSYGLKHTAERELSEQLSKSGGWRYVSNAEIKYALSELGHKHNPRWHYDINYTYQLSKNFYKSEAARRFGV